ncbi:MAG: murein biosynthesis integral membrane protein MurJ [Desulfobacterales bacterium]
MTRAAGIVAGLTLLSRLLGYVRDMAIAWVFGAGLYTDAFIAAFRIPNLLRRLLGEGALSLAFVPVFCERLGAKGRDEAMALAGSVFRYLAVVLTVLLAAAYLAAPGLVRLVVPGFAEDPQQVALTLHLTRIMLPYTVVVGLLALSMGVLNGVGRFGPPAAAPACLNVTMLAAIATGVLWTPDPRERLVWVAAGVLTGGVAQLCLQLPYLRQAGFNPRLGSWRRHPDLTRIGRMMPPAVFGAAAFQINILIGTLLGSLLTDGSISYLFFADRLIQFPLGLIALSVATAGLPTFSRLVEKGDLAGLRHTLDVSMRGVLFLTLPAMAGLVALRKPVVGLLFEHGAFSSHAGELTAQALLWYAVGLWAVAGLRVVLPVFFALQDCRSPVAAAGLSLLVNAAAGAALMTWMGHGGIALGTSIASILNLALLLRNLARRLGSVGSRRSAGSFLRMATCSLIMGGGVHLMAERLCVQTSGIEAFLGLVGCVAGGMMIYGVLSLITGSQELRMLLWAVFRRSGS